MEHSEQGRPNVLIVGGGIAGLEALIGLSDLAGGRGAFTLVAPSPDFAYRPWTVEEPFTFEPAQQLELGQIAQEFGAELVQKALSKVDPERKMVELDDSSTLPYDVLVICIGGRPVPAYPEVLTFGGGQDSAAMAEMLSGLRDRTGEEEQRIAFVVPPGNAWPLPIYELALMTRRRIWERGLHGIPCTIVTPEQAPLIIFGTVASQALQELLDARDIEIRTGVHASKEDEDLVLAPGGERIKAAHMVCLPLLEGPAIEGLPKDAGGFIPIDEHARVVGLEDVYAAGDGTTFPIKQGGLGTQQADAAAEHIAARLGAEVNPEPFHPVLRGLLVTGGESLSMSHSLTGGEGEGEASSDYLWWPPHKVSSRYLAPWLQQTTSHEEPSPPSRPVEVEVALPKEWHENPMALDPYSAPPID